MIEKNYWTILGSLKEALEYKPTLSDENNTNIEIPKPFNICVLGEVVDEDLIREKLRTYFSKYGLKTTDWDIVFFNNTKLKNSDVLSSLKLGQSKFNLIITGQIYHHSGKGNKSANILTELKNTKYINHIVGNSPQSLLTAENLLEKLDSYISDKYKI